jgi:hypothetical protein
MIMKGFFEELEKKIKADLISFGNYLLSKTREVNVSEVNKHLVTDADLHNWKLLNEKESKE